MIMSDTENKLNTDSVQRNRLETGADTQLKKEFFLAYSAYAAFLNAYEKTMLKPKRRVAFSKTIKTGVEARAERKHLDRAILAAESWEERDKLFRRLASHCYQNARWFEKNGDYKQAAKWMNLALRFLRLSLDPKAKEDLEHIQRELAEIKAQVKEQEKEGEEDAEG